MTAEPEPRVLREVVLDQLGTREAIAYKMWLPPLFDPIPVNELIERDKGQYLRFGVGVMDEPKKHRQDVWGFDVSGAGGNISIGGAPQTGKSTLLQTLILSAAATHSPRQVQFYCIDMGGGGLMYLEDLPHVGAVATRTEPDRVNRLVAEIMGALRTRERAFKQYRVGSMAVYRQMREDPNHPAAVDALGDVFLVIDGWPAFAVEFPLLEPMVQELAGQGLAFGVHTVIATPRWSELKGRVRDYLTSRLEFRVGDLTDSQFTGICKEVPANRPGRAVSAERHHLMMGVPRLDGVHSAENLVDAISDAVQRIGAGYTDEDEAPPVRVLPDRIYLRELDPNPPGPDADYRDRWQIPLGLREIDLSVKYADLQLTPNIVIFGGPKSGKTTIAHAIAQAICARNSPEQVNFIMADYRSGLLGCVPDSHLVNTGGINRNNTALEKSMKAAEPNLGRRLAPTNLTIAELRTRSWWTGADLVLLVDDWHMITAAAGPISPMAPLFPYIAGAADIGLHIIVTCQMSHANKAVMDRFVGAAFGGGAPTLFLSGDKQEYPSQEIKVKKRPPGQAFLVTPEGKEVIQAPYIDPPEEVSPAPPAGG